MLVSDEHLRGRTVIAADGQAIGEVAALFIDTSTWIVVALQIKLSKSCRRAARCCAGPAPRCHTRVTCPNGPVGRGCCPPIRSDAGTAADSFRTPPTSTREKLRDEFAQDGNRKRFLRTATASDTKVAAGLLCPPGRASTVIIVSSRKICEGAGLNSLQKFGFVSDALQNPFSVEVGTVHLTKITQDSFAAQCSQAGNKKSSGPSATSAMIASQDDGGQSEISAGGPPRWSMSWRQVAPMTALAAASTIRREGRPG